MIKRNPYYLSRCAKVWMAARWTGPFVLIVIASRRSRINSELYKNYIFFSESVNCYKTDGMAHHIADRQRLEQNCKVNPRVSWKTTAKQMECS